LIDDDVVGKDRCGIVSCGRPICHGTNRPQRIEHLLIGMIGAVRASHRQRRHLRAKRCDERLAGTGAAAVMVDLVHLDLADIGDDIGFHR
jgi:predicted metalloprotease